MPRGRPVMDPDFEQEIQSLLDRYQNHLVVLVRAGARAKYTLNGERMCQQQKERYHCDEIYKQWKKAKAMEYARSKASKKRKLDELDNSPPQSPTSGSPSEED